MAVGGEGRLALEARRREVADAAAVGAHDGNPDVGRIGQLERDPAAIRRPISLGGLPGDVGELAQIGAVGLDGVEPEPEPVSAWNRTRPFLPGVVALAAPAPTVTSPSTVRAAAVTSTISRRMAAPSRCCHPSSWGASAADATRL